LSGGIERLIETGAEEAGFETGGAEKGLLGESDPLDGEEFLGFVDGQEIVLEMGDIVEIFEADDGVRGCGEAVFAGVLGGAGLALQGARAGGTGGVDAVGGELFFGDGFLGHFGLLFKE